MKQHQINYKYIFILFTSLTIFLNSGCKIVSKTNLYAEPTIASNDIQIRRVAILPNRLPMNLQNPEYWRLFNFNACKKELTKRGIQVVDYDLSNEDFKRSGLPMEDTKSSRDKYAELAEKLNVDMLIFPYYGTIFSMGACFMAQNYKYIAVGSLQFYSPKHNDFSTRIDIEGTNYTNKLYQLIPIIGTIGALVEGARGDKYYYEEAFNSAIKGGFDEFFMKYPSGVGTGGSNMQNQQNTTGNKYSKFSLEDLETLKKAAVSSGDFGKAAEIKEEIDKRKK
jgi:hypothetical protein